MPWVARVGSTCQEELGVVCLQDGKGLGQVVHEVLGREGRAYLLKRSLGQPPEKILSQHAMVRVPRRGLCFVSLDISLVRKNS